MEIFQKYIEYWIKIQKKEYALKMILKHNNKLGNINYLKNCKKEKMKLQKNANVKI